VYGSSKFYWPDFLLQHGMLEDGIQRLAPIGSNGDTWKQGHKTRRASGRSFLDVEVCDQDTTNGVRDR
jgi:hypothetical protein